jgi:hypothetical protein
MEMDGPTLMVHGQSLMTTQMLGQVMQLNGLMMMAMVMAIIRLEQMVMIVLEFMESQLTTD